MSGPAPDPAALPVPSADAMGARMVMDGALAVSLYSLTLLVVALAISWYLKNDTLLISLSSIIAANATSTVNFWIGSSKGSQSKDAVIASQLPPPQSAQPAIPGGLNASPSSVTRP